MRTWLRTLQRLFLGRPLRQRPAQRLGLEPLEDRSLLSGNYLQTNLVSSVQGQAANFDPNLLNPWGLSYGPTSAFWASDNDANLATLYNGQGAVQGLVVKIPTASGGAPVPGTTGPTGTVFNTAGSGFNVSETTTVGGQPVTKTGSSVFLFATLDGTISGWSPSVDLHNAIIGEKDPNASYTGLAFDTDSIGRNLLYAADFAKGTIDVFNSSFTATTVPGGFVDTRINTTNPKQPEYHPFNIQNLGGLLYVTYAQFDPSTGSDVPGMGHGFVDVFNSDGVLQQRLVQHGPLSSPWGLALAPSNFGDFSGDLLVGNNGNGMINAFNPHNGQFEGTVKDAQGNPIVINDLWALKFGNGGAAGPTNTLFFNGLPTGSQFTEQNSGLFGSLTAIPELAPRAPIIPNLSTLTPQTFSTVPANGDLNPYGVAFVPSNVAPGGKLQTGDILVSNFNDAQNQQNTGNLQGTGTTIVEISPQGQSSVFFQGQAGLGLTTALGVLRSGFVLVGNVPTTDGTSATIGQGSLLILDHNGNQVANLTDSALLDGPWDLAVNDMGNRAEVFVANVLSGTVTRIDLAINPANTANPVTVTSKVQIASGYQHRADSAALELGPTGLAYDPQRDILYVASTEDNAIYAIANASRTTDHGTGTRITLTGFPQGDFPLRGPLALVLAPNGDLIVSNGDAINPNSNEPSELVEITPRGQFIGQFSVDAAPGSAFGVAVSSTNGGLRFAAVDDNTNTLDVWTFTQHG